MGDFNAKGRVCIVTAEFPGPSRGGMIAAQYGPLATRLSREGFQVTVLFAGQFEVENADHWHAFYNRQGINFVHYCPVAPFPIEPQYLAKSYHIYLWLKEREFDVIHFHDWLGLGYYAALARHQGLAFDTAQISVGVLRPSLYIRQHKGEFIDDIAVLQTDFMEQRTCLYADHTWTIHREMFLWAQERGWGLPEEKHSIRSAMFPEMELLTSAAKQERLEEVVYIGPVEEMGGLFEFSQAISQLPSDLAVGLRITFIGKVGQMQGRDARTFLQERFAKWPMPVTCLQELSDVEALAYLDQRRSRVLAVIPAKADFSEHMAVSCISHRIPFIATEVGGVKQLVPERLWNQILCRPVLSELAQLLERRCRAPHIDLPMNPDALQTANEWVKWHARQHVNAWPRNQPVTHHADPLVTVCITHYNRPKLLRQAVQSIADQDYPHIELIVVDDGSTSSEAIECLRALEIEFAPRQWRVIRQRNAYLGAARNTGARYATGKYIVFIDDDDFAKPNKVSTLVRVAERIQADILTSMFDRFTGDEAPTPGLQPSLRWLFAGGPVSVGLTINEFGGANGLIRVDALKELGGFTEEYGLGHEDWEFYSKAALRGYRVEVCPEALYWYRVTGETSMLASTSVYNNYMRSIRPYLDSVPPDLRDVMQLAFGSIMKTRQLHAVIQYLSTQVQAKDQQLSQLGTASNQMLTQMKDIQARISALISERDALRSELHQLRQP